MSNVTVMKGNQLLSSLTAHCVYGLPDLSLLLIFSNIRRTNFSYYEVANRLLMAWLKPG
jgi:hypothetical protein